MTQQALSFRKRVIEKFLQLASPARAGAVSVYSALTVALYTQLASAFHAGGPEAVAALGLSLGSGVLTSLLASHVYDAQKPDDTAALLAKIEELCADDHLRQEVEQHLHALQINQEVLVQAVLSQRLTEADREWLVATIRDELAPLIQPLATNPNEEALRESYLNHLYEEAGEISFVGVDPQAAADPNAPAARAALGDIYVPLLTAEAQREDLSDKDGSARLRGTEMDDPRAESRRLSAITQLDRHPRLVLLGDPGSGKTTFARFVAQCLAGAELGGEMDLGALVTPTPGREEAETWSHGALFPAMVELRRLAAVALPPVGAQAHATHLLDFLGRQLAESGLAEFAPHLGRLLRYPGGLVALDGLDEVPEADQRRAQILQMIEDFAALYPNCRLLVTSRTYSYRHQGWRLRGFHEAELRPFEPEQVEAFVDRWYEHTVSIGRREKDDARGRASRLKEAISATPRLAELAARPLLLTLMAALHDSRGGDLPEKRWQLYEETVELLLVRWNRRLIERTGQGAEIVRLPDLAAWLQVDRDKVRQLLNRLAFEAHRGQADLRGTADIPEAELVTGLFELAKESPDVNTARIIEFLKLRAGLLLAHGEEVYTFPHRTLQEYLAACHLTDFDYPYQLAELARDEPDRWREVALLAGGKAAAGAQFAIWALADALCPDDCPEPEQPRRDAWGALIAGLALVESADLAQIPTRHGKTVKRLQGHWVRILEEGKLPAIERASAGRVLAQLGDPRPGVGLDATGLPDIVWCDIPAGSFTMGSLTVEEGPTEYQRLQHICEIPYDYCISRYPITVAQYQAFAEAGGYAEERWWSGTGWMVRCILAWIGPEVYETPFSLPNRPVVGVSWYEAMAFARWLTAQLQDREGWVVDLPSEAEWEKAARGSGDARLYPWGAVFEPDRANCSDTGIDSTSAVGCFPGGVSPYGVEDCSGNVCEWTRNLFAMYPYLAGDGREDSEELGERVVRGGSWGDLPSGLGSLDLPAIALANRRTERLGFRCVLRPPRR